MLIQLLLLLIEELLMLILQLLMFIQLAVLLSLTNPWIRIFSMILKTNN
jgi:hypothetical protein